MIRCQKHPKYQGKSAPRVDCPACQAIYSLQKERKKNLLLTQQLDNFVKTSKFSIHAYKGETIRFGLLSDTHLGSLYERTDVLNLAYKLFADEGIKNVYHAGD